MQQQVLEDAEVRLTEEEASLVVALHSEQEQKLGVTTLRDLAETLRIPLPEAERLLAQARAKLAPAAEALKASPAQDVVGPKRRPRGWRWISFLAYTAIVAGGASYFTWAHSIRRYLPWRPQPGVMATSTASAPIASESSSPYMNIGPSPYQVSLKASHSEALGIGSEYYADPQAPLIRSKVEQAVFDMLDQGYPDVSADFMSVRVRNQAGQEISFDLPVDGSIQKQMASLKGRQLLRTRIHEAVAKVSSRDID